MPTKRRNTMNVVVRASTKPNYQVSAQELNELAGKSAGVCYMPENFAVLNIEPLEKTMRRSEGTKASGHHSVFSHGYITLELENIPKLFAMLLNNEKVYNTSEKSARYTKMELNGIEKYLYDKWLKNMEVLITEKYGNLPYFDKKRITKLAQENARYFTSVMTPTSMVYTVDYRQLNYMCGWMQEFKNRQNPIYQMLAPTAEDFLTYMDSFGYLDNKLMHDGKGREFSLIGKRIREEQFGECYSVNYEASFACFAQAQRHRTLHYEFTRDLSSNYFIPLILRDYPYLAEEWLRDMELVAHLTPQGELINVNERGDYENLILKARERLCTAAQLEVMRNTNNTINRMIRYSNNKYVREDLKAINTGARCTSGFKCATPCAFKEGIDLSRLI